MTSFKPGIPRDSAKINKGKIPNKAALFRDTVPQYVISFKYYNDKNCEVTFLEKNKLEKCIDVLKRVSQSRMGGLSEQNIDQIKVHNSGGYSKLYNRLPDSDIQLFEHKLQEKARIFYFLMGYEFCITAITKNHLQTDKTRH